MAGLISKVTPFLNSVSTELKALAGLGVTAPAIWFLLPHSANSPLTHVVHLSALSFQVCGIPIAIGSRYPLSGYSGSGATGGKVQVTSDVGTWYPLSGYH